MRDVRRVRAREEVLRLCKGWLRTLLMHTAEEEVWERSRGGALSRTDSEPADLWAKSLDAPEHETTAYLLEDHADLDPSLHVLAHAPAEIVEISRCALLSTAKRAEHAPTGRDKTALFFTLDKQVSRCMLHPPPPTHPGLLEAPPLALHAAPPPHTPWAA